MNETEQQIAIAEACGWEFHPQTGPLDFPWWHRNTKERAANETLPDYLHDRNALWEAVNYCKDNVMDADQWEEFGKALEKAHPTAVLLNATKRVRLNFVDCVNDPATVIDFYEFATLIFELTPPQIAECLLRTIRKWKEQEL